MKNNQAKNYPQTNIHPNAIIGDNVSIAPWVTIEEDVIIGDNCIIKSNVVIMSGTRIGNNCKIFPGAVLGAEPQDLKYGGEKTTLEVGNNVIIREYCTLNRGTKAFNKTVVGDNTLLMAYVHIAHDCIVGKNCVLANNATLAGHVEIDDYTILGGMTAIQQFVRVGSHVMLGGGTLLNKDVPPYVRVARYPASYIGVNSIGLNRKGFEKETIRYIQNLYHKLFISGSNFSRAIKEIEDTVDDSVIKEQILNFVKKSKNGIIKGMPRKK